MRHRNVHAGGPRRVRPIEGPCRNLKGVEATSGTRMKIPNVKAVLIASFVAIAAVAAALGCPVFRNPANYAGAGGIVGYLRYVVAVHRKH